jgi:hypothetical protein
MTQGADSVTAKLVSLFLVDGEYHSLSPIDSAILAVLFERDDYVKVSDLQNTLRKTRKSIDKSIEFLSSKLEILGLDLTPSFIETLKITGGASEKFTPNGKEEYYIGVEKLVKLTAFGKIYVKNFILTPEKMREFKEQLMREVNDKQNDAKENEKLKKIIKKIVK